MFDQRGHNNQVNGTKNDNKNGEDFVLGTDRKKTTGVDCYNFRKS